MEKSIQAGLMPYEAPKPWTHRVKYGKWWILAVGEQDAERKAAYYARLGYEVTIELIKGDFFSGLARYAESCIAQAHAQAQYERRHRGETDEKESLMRFYLLQEGWELKSVFHEVYEWRKRR